MERRIDLSGSKPNNDLKQIAGRIQTLSFRDMQALSVALAKNVTSSSSEGFAEGLLKTSDEILATPAKPAAAGFSTVTGEDFAPSSANRRAYRG